jgi:hypothetical protein
MGFGKLAFWPPLDWEETASSFIFRRQIFLWFSSVLLWWRLAYPNTIILMDLQDGPSLNWYRNAKHVIEIIYLGFSDWIHPWWGLGFGGRGDKDIQEKTVMEDFSISFSNSFQVLDMLMIFMLTDCLVGICIVMQSNWICFGTECRSQVSSSRRRTHYCGSL